ncbi:Universal stress protein family 3 [Caenispirillum salinarum AK4]|uniref:Universal stress protein family 3 n=1 Tax=Caenispirillum salinarum AK4 TaxID=1238182 RepID=K9GVH1_9PROT|nr:universal stress protein [Caenispirillum salinarum]EKV29182.1 Universal stress protein family 3 [Caenispirillum salinarum AK4]
MYQNILVAIDLDDPSDLKRTLATAVELNQATGQCLHVMTVLPTFGMSMVGQFFPKGYEKEMADKLLHRLREEIKPYVPDGMHVQHIVGEGNVYETVLRMAEKTEADLIVIGAHRPELKDYLLGPNAARVVRHANVSVLVVRE